jgi:hypothetical protein
MERLSRNVGREKTPIMEKFPNMGRCIISYQEVLRSELKNVNHYADEVINCNHIINGQLLKTSLLTRCQFWCAVKFLLIPKQ